VGLIVILFDSVYITIRPGISTNGSLYGMMRRCMKNAASARLFVSERRSYSDFVRKKGTICTNGRNQSRHLFGRIWRKALKNG
jgi:hypothetical protein